YDLRSPHPGDIVVFKAPANWSETPPPKPASNPVLHGLQWAGQLVGLLPPEENDFVKRVIATGGQTVQCCDTQGRVQVSDTGPNGPFHSLNEPYIFQNLPWNPADKPGQPAADGSPEGQSPTDSRTFGPVTVPKGRLWVMGDHRDVSADSRYNFVHQNLGVHDSTIAVNSLIGKAVLIIWPPSRWRTLGTPAGLTQYATGLGGTTAPLLSAAATVIPLGRRRRKKRRNRAA
ncbi:MAG TPA: signal peptidase I, partial [Jatrophihabitantaceae bacterium]|nr:signal peptidase I [Jatrophihabitantaceae bacterium]